MLSRLDILEHDIADLKDRITDLHRTMDEHFDRINSELNERFELALGAVGLLALRRKRKS